MRVTIGEPLPKWMTPFVRRISELGVFDGKDANHVLVNEYSCGQGIMVCVSAFVPDFLFWILFSSSTSQTES